MRGHVRKRGNKWVIVVDRERSSDGKRQQKWHSGYATRKDAERALPDLLRSIQRGEYVEPSKQTLGAFLDEWLPSIRSTVRASTLASYRQQIENHLKPRLGGVALQSLTPTMLNSAYASLAEDGKRNGARGGLSPRTIRYVHVVLRRALNDAVKCNLVSRNVADFATPPRQRRNAEVTSDTWSPDEVRRFLQHIEEHALRPLLVLALSTGMRRGELIGLRWRDVDLDARTITIRQQVTNTNNELVVSPPKTARGARCLAIDPTSAQMLRSLRSQQAEARLASGRGKLEGDLVFPRPDGGFLHPDWVSKTFAKLVKGADVPKIRFHDLRHTHATLALRANLNPKVVSERLGHANVSITLDTYSHAIPAMQEEAAGKVASLIFG